jgi:DNA-binding NtrC family response regulator
VRESLADILTGAGYGVETAGDGMEALDRMARTPFDVVILDLAMPHLDGVETLRHLEEAHPVMIICSAFEFYTLEELEADVGAKVFRFLRKPVPPQQLVSVIDEALESAGGPSGP